MKISEEQLNNEKKNVEHYRSKYRKMKDGFNEMK